VLIGKKLLDLAERAADQRKLADAATDFSTRMHHRRIEEGCTAEMKAAKEGFLRFLLPK
jgi:hypothetical protein